jgi:cysteine synthase B
LGIGVHLALPENASRQRHQILRALGAELTLTDPLEGSDGARIVAQELADRHPERTYFANQYENPANWQAHYLSTGPEIVEQTQGALTHFVAGLGTTGTLIGVGRFLNETLPDVKLVAVQPDQPFHGLEGLKHLPSSPIPGIFDPSIPDETVHIRTEAAYGMARRLAREEGLLVGVSSAAAALAAIEIGRRLEKGLIVTIFPDSGLKYLDEPFWSAG